MKLYLFWTFLISLCKPGLLQPTNAEQINLNLCGTRTILVCWENTRIQITSFKCPLENNTICSIYSANLKISKETCDGRSQCRLKKSDDLKEACIGSKESLNITFICVNEKEMIFPTKDLVYYEKTERITIGNKSVINSADTTTGSTTPIPTTTPTITTSEVLVIKSKQSTATKNNNKETTKEVTSSKVPDNDRKKIITTVATTFPTLKSSESSTSTSDKAAKTKTATTTTTTLHATSAPTIAEGTVDIKSVYPETTETIVSTTPSESVTKMTNHQTISKTGSDVFNVTKTAVRNIINTTLSTKPGVECLNKDGSIKEDGNYQWVNHLNCFLQCTNGKVNWRCCRPTSYVYVTKCRKCLSPRNKDNCDDGDSHNATTEYKDTKSTGFPAKIETELPPTRLVIGTYVCTEETTGDIEFKGEYTFHQTTVVDTVVLQCRYGALFGIDIFERKCLFEPRYGAYWEDLDLSNCAPKNDITKKLMRLDKTKVTSKNVMKVSNDLLDVWENKDEISDNKKVNLIIDVIEKSLQFINKTTQSQVSENILEVIDRLSTLENDVISPSSAGKVLSQINSIGKSFKVPNGNSSITITKENIALAVTKSDKKAIKFSFSSDENMECSVDDRLEDDEESQSIIIPKSAMELIPKNTYFYFYALRNNDFFQGDEEDKVESNILSATANGVQINHLVEPIEIILNRFDTEKEVICKYWKVVNASYGTWSSDGCSTIEKHDSISITCRCTHLTNFALILDTEQQRHNPLVLKIFSFIGCLFSILGVGITLITFLCFRKLRQKIPAKILICLCTSLLLLLVVFVGGVRQTKRASVCHVVAGMLHYFTLTTFAWMLVEAVNLYRTVVKVFTTGNEGRFFKWIFLYAWGVPAIIVGVTGYLTRDHFQGDHHDDHHSDYCLVRGVTFYYALLLPVCLSILINFVVFIPVFNGIVSGEKLVKDSIQERQKIHARRAKASFMVVVVLGLSWIFGVLAIGDLRDVFQWLFCILSSFQGFFIFVLFVLMNQDARKAWKNICRPCRRTRSKKCPSSYASSVRMLKQTSITNEPSIVINGEAFNCTGGKLQEGDENSDDEFDDYDDAV